MSRTNRKANIHHLYFPRREYTTPLEREFRELPCNKVQLDMEVHRLLHINSSPPRKPPRGDMLHAIHRHEKGLCACYVQIARAEATVVNLQSERELRRGA